MRNWLVIHNDNIPKSLLKDFKEGQQDVLEFDITPALQMNENFSFDYETAEILKNHFSNKKKYECIFIPYNLNKELYLDFSGLKVALHIRLSPELDHTFCPIVFYGYEDPLHVAKLSPYSKILFSIGSLTLTSSKISFENFNLTCDYLKEMTHEAFVNFLNELNIIPVDDYKSHHSTANELALFQWSKYIGCDDQIAEVKVNRNRLYFKYLEAKRLFKTDVGWVSEIEKNDLGPPQINITLKYKEEKINPPEYIINGNIKEGKDKEGKTEYRLAKVLLIDDEAKKGWESFYANLFKLNPVEEERVAFDSLKLQDKEGREIKFKNLNREQIIESAINKVEEFDPDIVLLDLRLQDDDFIQDVSPNNLTGIQIAKAIHIINKGIQVIITSASNKIPNYLASFKKGLGVDGYIIKSLDIDPEVAIIEIIKTINNSIQRAEFLKPVVQKIKLIKSLLHPKNDDETKGLDIFIKLAEVNLEIALKLFNDYTINPRYINFGFLQLFMLIEDFVKTEGVFRLYYKDDKPICVVKCKDIDVLVLEHKKSPMMDYHDKKKRYIYKTGNSNYDRSVDTNYKVSSLLIFRYGLENSDQLNWIELRDIRNNKAAHPGSLVEQGEALSLLDFIAYLMTDNKQNDCNIKYQLTPLKGKPRTQVENQLGSQFSELAKLKDEMEKNDK